MANGEDDGFWPLIERIKSGATTEEVRARALDAFRSLGFGAAYFLAPVVSDPRIGRYMVNCGFPIEWEDAYRAGDYLNDPLPSIAITRRGAFKWHDELGDAKLRAYERDYMTRSAGHGFERGIAVPCFGPFARCGFIGVGLPFEGAQFDISTMLKVETSARVAYQRYLRLSDPFPGNMPKLSGRETEVLNLLAQGKSNAVIAQLLDIAASSVDVYVKRIFAKLGVADRTSAAVQALALGLVVTGKHPGRPH